MRINRSSGSLLITALVLVVASSAVTWIVSTGSGETVQMEAANSPGAVPAFIPQAGTAAVPRRPLHTAGNLVSGAAPGLYGGTESNSCDIAAMQAYLETHPDRAAAWATALMIDPSQIDEHFASLTPVTLQTDTAVTNHGFDSGTATPFQTVLQAGTAVLVDAVGLPRVRCYCGNPLQNPAPRRSIRYVGARWDGFDAQSVTEIHMASTVIQQFVVVERELDGDVARVVNRPRATRGERDEAAAPALAQDIQLNFRLGRIGPDGSPSTPGPPSTPTTPSTSTTPSTVLPTTSPAPGPPPTSTAVAPTVTSIAPTPVPPTTTAGPLVTSEPPVPETSVIPGTESPATTEPASPATTRVVPPEPEVTEPEPEVTEPEPEETEPEPEEGDTDPEEGGPETDGDTESTDE
jgi:uncharacterized protein DUF6777